MSIREVTMYQVACDGPDCEVDTSSIGEYSAWGDEDTAQAEWDDWGITTDEGLHYCEKHWQFCAECGSEQIPKHDGALSKCAACIAATTAHDSKVVGS